MLVFNPRCKLAIQQMKAYRGKRETKFTGEGGVVKKFDEANDCIRYLCTKSPFYVKRHYNHMADEKPAPVKPEMSTEQMEHESRLRRSAQRMREIHPATRNAIGTGFLRIG